MFAGHIYVWHIYNSPMANILPFRFYFHCTSEINTRVKIVLWKLRAIDLFEHVRH